MVDKREEEADNGKVEENAPVGVVRVERQLVVASHDGRGNQIRQYDATEDDEDVLGDEPPRRVAGPKKRRLSRLAE